MSMEWNPGVEAPKQEGDKNEILNEFSSEENVIYEKYKKQTGHDYAIMQVEAMRNINNLSAELKVVAEKYLKDKNGEYINAPSAALHQAEAIQEINQLQPGLAKEIALAYYNDGNGYGPTHALKHAIEDSQKINTLEAKDIERVLLGFSLNEDKKSVSEIFRKVRVKKMIEHLLKIGMIK